MSQWREEILGDGQVRETAIYALCEPGGVNPRYVGKTHFTVGYRQKAHIRQALRKPRLPVHRWIKSLYDKGLWSCAWHLETVPPEGGWQARERYWIARFRADGARLLNLTDGGEGIAGHTWPEDRRKRLSEKNKRGSFFACLQCGKQFWRKPHEIKSGDCKYCSKGCYQESQRGKSKPVSTTCTIRGVMAAAIKRRSQTHCKRGHPLSGDNLFSTSKGSRGCKECRKLHKLTYRSKQ